MPVSIHESLNHEPSVWLRQAIVDRLTALAPTAADLSRTDVVALMLTDELDDREDRTCDRCRVYTPRGTTFYGGLYAVSPDRLPRPWSRRLAGRQVLVGYGLCAECAPLEVGPLDQPGPAAEGGHR